MKKNLSAVLLSFFISLFAIPVFAQSNLPETNMGWTGGVKVQFRPGWNLVSPFSMPMSVVQPQPLTSETYSEHLYLYGFDVVAQKYVGGDVFTDGKAKNELEDTFSAKNGYGPEEIMGSTSMFVYLSKKQADTANSSDPINYRYLSKTQKLIKGWNFLSITPSMAERRISEFKGDCIIKKAYGLDYDAKGKNYWNDLLDESLNTELVGYGFIVQVENNCSFSFVKTEPIPSIPTLPN